MIAALGAGVKVPKLGTFDLAARLKVDVGNVAGRILKIPLMTKTNDLAISDVKVVFPLPIPFALHALQAL